MNFFEIMYNSMPAQMCLLYVSLIEIAHQATYIKWLCLLLYIMKMNQDKRS